MNLPCMDLKLAKVYDIEIRRPDLSSEPVILNGFVQSPAVTTIQAKASVQPAPSREVEQLPESDTLHEVMKVWSQTELRVRDQVTWQGKEFSILKLMSWPIPTFKIGHYSALMTGVEASNNAD